MNSELDRRIPYSLVPTVHGIPLSRRVVDAFDVLDEALVVARAAKPGLTVGDLVADVRAARGTL
jgi:hypothetical protein